MSKRASLATVSRQKRTMQRVGRVADGAAPAPAAQPEKGVVTSVNLAPDVLERLRIAAAKRATRDGGRPSVSALVNELVREHGPDVMVMTGLHLPAELLNLLRRVAVKRAERGGRVSVSAVLTDLVRRHRAELEGEL